MYKTEKLIEAAKLLKEHCKNGNCDTCPFHRDERPGYCALNTGLLPDVWKLPKIRRWTDKDVTLAKALKAFGATHIYRADKDSVYWGVNKSSKWSNELPNVAFASLEVEEFVTVEEIIAEERDAE